MALDCLSLLVYLRRCGIVTHHVAPMPATAYQAIFVVFLEGNLAQSEMAAEDALRMPGVESVSFSECTRAIMFVTAAPA